MTRIAIQAEAVEQIREIRTFWGPRFSKEYVAAVRQIRVTPLIGALWSKDANVRRKLLHGCQHYIYYRYDPKPVDEVVILAVWSNARGEGPPLKGL